MIIKNRIDKNLFVDNHYLGKPADFTDRIVNRRIELVRKIEGFTGADLSLVDIGCGNGASLFLLAKEMGKCIGVDIISDHKIEFEKYVKENNYCNCQFLLADIEKDKIDNKFDRLVSFEVIEHLKDDKNVQAFYNILKNGGIAAITVPNKWWIFETHGAKLPFLPWNRVPFFSWLPKPIHEKFANARIYTKNRIKNLLESVGFQVINIEYITAPLDVLKDSKLKSFLTRYFFNKNTTTIPFLSTALFIVAKKNKQIDK